MAEAFPTERAAKRRFLLDAVESISKTLRASGAQSEELGTLAPDAVDALVRTGMFKLKLAAEMGGAEADPVTEMLVLEALAYHDLTSGWCTMVGATAIASLGTFLPPAGLAKVFTNGTQPARLNPAPTPIKFCSATPTSKNRSGKCSLNPSVMVPSAMSASTTTTRLFVLPRSTSASP